MDDTTPPESSQLDEVTDAQVEKFAHAICEWIVERFPDRQLELHDDGDVALDETETKHARIVHISTDLGTIRILPDFRKQSAAAMVINMGLVNAMLKEGYDYDYIGREGAIYSDPVPFKDSTVEVLAYYLTHKLNLVK